MGEKTLTFDGSKSLGEHLYEALLSEAPDLEPEPWDGGTPEEHATFERAAVNFVSRLSAADALSDWDARIAELQSTVIAFCAPWAVTYAREHGLPPNHLYPNHYDILESCGARMVDFTRALLTPTGTEIKDE